MFLRKEERLREALPEVVARMVEKMVTDMASLHQKRIFERESLGPEGRKGSSNTKASIILRTDVEDPRAASQVNPSIVSGLASERRVQSLGLATLNVSRCWLGRR